MPEHIVTERVLDFAESSYHMGECPAATHRGHIENPACGDMVHIELRICTSGLIDEAWFQSRGCLISRAAAAMLIAEVEGKSAATISTWQAPHMLDLFGSPLTAKRQVCCLLGLFALQRALTTPVTS